MLLFFIVYSSSPLVVIQRDSKRDYAGKCKVKAARREAGEGGSRFGFFWCVGG